MVITLNHIKEDNKGGTCITYQEDKNAKQKTLMKDTAERPMYVQQVDKIMEKLRN
jgi:hypothetical protein